MSVLTLFLNDNFLVILLISEGSGFQKAGPFALKLCELILDLVTGRVRGFVGRTDGRTTDVQSGFSARKSRI